MQQFLLVSIGETPNVDEKHGQTYKNPPAPT